MPPPARIKAEAAGKAGRPPAIASAVLEALKCGPMTTEELRNATGLTLPQIRQAIKGAKGKKLKVEPKRYALITKKDVVALSLKML